jgi:hypothetical protein
MKVTVGWVVVGIVVLTTCVRLGIVVLRRWVGVERINAGYFVFGLRRNVSRANL